MKNDLRDGHTIGLCTFGVMCCVLLPRHHSFIAEICLRHDVGCVAKAGKHTEVRVAREKSALFFSCRGEGDDILCVCGSTADQVRINTAL